MKGLAFLLAASSLAALPLAAQTPLRAGQTVTGSLEAGDARMEDGAYYDSYVIQGRPGDRFRVRMRSGDFDTYLRWGSPADGGWSEVAANDDSGEGTDSRLAVTIGSDGVYELRAGAFAEGEEGAYELSVAELPAFGEVQPGRIRVGQTVQGELTDTDFEGEDGPEDHYVLTGRPGEVVTVYAESDAFDTYLVVGGLGDGVFHEMDADDDGGVETNSQLVLEFERGGEYHLLVRSFGGGDGGPYTLRVREGAQEPVEDEEMTDDVDVEDLEGDVEWADAPDILEQGSVVGAVAAGSDVRGALGEGDETAQDIHWYHDYTFRAAAGDRLTVRVSSEEIDSYVSIGQGQRDEFESLGEDDDGGEDLDSLLEFEVPEAGQYTIRVSSALPGQRGRYVLRVDRER